MFQNKQRKYLVVILITVFACLLLGGCGLGQTLDSWKSGDPTTPDSIETGKIIIDQPLVIDSTETPAAAEEPPVSMMQVSLYFADASGTKLVKETRMIPKEIGVARSTINELILGPQEELLLPTLPAGTVLNDINIKDGVCIVDFNAEFQKGITTAEEESLCIYSLVNTLTQFESVDQVKIRINGKNVDKFTGAIDVSANISRNESIIGQQ